jgi:hypothetical protein
MNQVVAESIRTRLVEKLADSLAGPIPLATTRHIHGTANQDDAQGGTVLDQLQNFNACDRAPSTCTLDEGGHWVIALNS